jgi:archaeal type IV pilus assembly protein PilA
MGRTLWYSKKGISTIIATIIIVSVSIVMAIAVGFWAMGIGNSFTKFEKVEFTSIYADPQRNYNATIQQPDGNYFNGTAFTVYITLKNTGTAAATINNVFLNSRPYDSGYDNITQSGIVGTTLAVGQSLSPRGLITLPISSGIWSSGMSVQVEIQTAAGRSYSNTVVLP